MIRPTLLATLAALTLTGCATLPNAQAICSPLSKVDMTLAGTRAPGEPLVVLIHGLGSDMGTWKPLIGPLSARHQVFAYDRPGYGNSGWSNRKRDAKNIAEELHATLMSAGLKAPYLIVGHSLGGTYAQEFASLYSDETAGMVLIDPVVPRQQRLLEKHGPLQAIFIGSAMLEGSPMPRREFFNQNENDAEMAALTPYDRGPVTILMAMRGDPLTPSGYANARRDAMAAMTARYHATLSPVESGHFIHKEQPGLLLSVIDRMIG